MLKKILIGIVLAGGIVFIAMQLVPYGHAHTNPPVTSEPQWDSPQTRELAKRACFDCHSSETVWPWYSNIAPVSWLIQHDVDEGRSRMNFSQWNLPQRETRGAARQVERGEMPPPQYLLLHPSANLSPAEKQVLIQGLSASLAQR
jgi:mono/diheme cytochrome c family protein